MKLITTMQTYDEVLEHHSGVELQLQFKHDKVAEISKNNERNAHLTPKLSSQSLNINKEES